MKRLVQQCAKFQSSFTFPNFSSCLRRTAMLTLKQCTLIRKTLSKTYKSTALSIVFPKLVAIDLSYLREIIQFGTKESAKEYQASGSIFEESILSQPETFSQFHNSDIETHYLYKLSNKFHSNHWKF